MKVSLVIPVFNESQSIEVLLESIQIQSLAPDEVLLVDGGSTDDTVLKIKRITETKSNYKVIEAGRVMPGKGRNIGTASASASWIAFTDAGIRLDKNWLSCLVEAAEKNHGASIIYGNYHPIVDSFFERCATIAYVDTVSQGNIRGKFIASSLMKKEVWEKTGGFPDWRAAEDLVFMERVERLGYKAVFAPDAKVYWQLRQDIRTTFKRFALYSMYNIWAGRQAKWHYGVLRHYGVMLLFGILGFIHHPLWLLMIPGWMILRAMIRGFRHRYEFGLGAFLNPWVVGTVTLITSVIDLATFTGWLKALIQKNPLKEVKQ